MRQKTKFGLVLFIGTLLITSCSDLRTKVSKKTPDERKAKELLHKMGAAHGIANWEKLATYTVTFEDEFFGKIGNNAKPYPEANTQFELDYIPGTFDGRMTFKGGEWDGNVWGMQSWNTYELNSEGKTEFKENKDARFWVPTYQYFIEFPSRIQEATAFAYAGERTIDGIACEGIIASWNTTKPQRKIDQYLIWIAKDTKRIYKLEYTIRELYSFLTGAAYFKDYKNYDGIYLPSKLPVESNLSKNGWLHEMRIIDFTANKVEKSALRPNKDLDQMGDEK